MGVGVILVRQSIGVGHAPLGQVGHGGVRVHILRGCGDLGLGGFFTHDS